MDMIPLQATARPTETSAKQMRRSGLVPCIVYGTVKKNLTIQCKEFDLHRAFVKAGESTLVELQTEEAKIPVLFKDVSFDPVSGREIHVDFYAVNMNKEIETMVQLKITGEAPAVKDLGAILVVPHNTVKVRCLPKDLPHELLIDISKLAACHDTVTVAAIALPKGVTVIDTPTTVVAVAQEPRKEEEIVPVATEAAATAEGAVPAEGVPGAEGAAAGATAEKGQKAEKAEKAEAATKGGKEKK